MKPNNHEAEIALYMALDQLVEAIAHGTDISEFYYIDSLRESKEVLLKYEPIFIEWYRNEVK